MAPAISAQTQFNTWFPCLLRYNVHPENPLPKCTKEFYLMSVHEL